MVYFSRMNKSDLKEIKDIVDLALGTHLASVHEEITASSLFLQLFQSIA